MKNIIEYFAEIQRIIKKLHGIEIEGYDEQVLSERRGNLRIRLRFRDYSLLELSEAVYIAGEIHYGSVIAIIIRILLEALYFAMIMRLITQKLTLTQNINIFLTQSSALLAPALTLF